MTSRLKPRLPTAVLFGHWATAFATSPHGRLNVVLRNMLESLGDDSQQRILKLHNGGHGFELWQTGDGLWHCRISVGSDMTHCVRAVAHDAIRCALGVTS